jgi:hypothetical protein
MVSVDAEPTSPLIPNESFMDREKKRRRTGTSLLPGAPVSSILGMIWVKRIISTPSKSCVWLGFNAGVCCQALRVSTQLPSQQSSAPGGITMAFLAPRLLLLLLLPLPLLLVLPRPWNDEHVKEEVDVVISGRAKLAYTWHSIPIQSPPSSARFSDSKGASSRPRDDLVRTWYL